MFKQCSINVQQLKMCGEGWPQGSTSRNDELTSKKEDDAPGPTQ